jgi:hypothetical protein
MSLSVEHFVVKGVKLDYKAADQMISKHMGDSDFQLAYEHYSEPNDSGLRWIADGMNTEYWIIGQVLASSDNWEGFDEVIEIPNLDPAGDAAMLAKIQALFGVSGQIKTYVLSHFS